MTGRLLALALVLAAPGCLDWEEADDATAGEPLPPPLRHVTPAGLPPIRTFDTGELGERCRTVCTRYIECFGTGVDMASCESICTSEIWVQDADDLACFLSSGCTELYLCYDG
jgi:hypothetical protein